MSSTSRHKTSNKLDNKKEREEKRRTPSPVSIEKANASNEMKLDPDVLEELKKLRKENQEGHSQTKMCLERVEQTVKDIKDQLIEHEERIERAEERISMVEDTSRRHQRAIKYLLHREWDLTAKCDELENRMRRNNIRIYQVPEGSEGKDTAGFVKKLLDEVLNLPSEIDIKIERAHRSLMQKPTDTTAPPRSIIVRFLDAAVKDAIIRQAWSQGQIHFREKRIFFDQDYSPDLQRRRAKVYEAVKQLKKKGIQAKCVYPAQLRLKLSSGEKTFSTLKDATTQLKELDIEIRCGERERMEEELKEKPGNKRRERDTVLSTSDIKALIQEG